MSADEYELLLLICFLFLPRSLLFSKSESFQEELLVLFPMLPHPLSSGVVPGKRLPLLALNPFVLTNSLPEAL